jgi:hypothetical protein
MSPRRQRDDEEEGGPRERRRLDSASAAEGPVEADGSQRSPGSHPWAFVHDPERFGRKGAGNQQVKYGPTASLSDEDLDRVDHHVLGRLEPQGPVRSRLTQYHKAHAHYAQDALRTGRGLSQEEAQAATTGKNAANASIDHVIASGVGQNTLNTSLAQFLRAGAGPAAVPGGAVPMRGELAAQAAAVGRVQMYNRAFAFEGLDAGDRGLLEDEERLGRSPRDGGAWWAARDRLDEARNRKLRETLSVMEGKDRTRRGAGPDPGFETEDAYKRLMKDTFDSSANLRVGHGGSNGQILTGFDGETDGTGRQLTARSSRMLEAHLAAEPDQDDQIVTLTPTGQALSSSREAAVQPTEVRSAKRARSAAPKPRAKRRRTTGRR